MNIKSVKLYKNGFWGRRVEQVREEIVPYQWRALNDKVPGAPPSHAMENFRIAAGLAKGEFYGFVFQDSDVYKWLEAVSYCLMSQPDLELERLADEVIDIIVKAQHPDGYLNTYFTIKEPKKRWTNLRDNHEMYCAGHLIEAAVAYYQATGKRKLLDAACRLADHIDSLFGPESNKWKGYRGHPEVELALVKLFKTTGDHHYLELSQFFIDQWGRNTDIYTGEEARRLVPWFLPTQFPKPPSWWQAHRPVREQCKAVGHAVMAMYLYSAMADLALETGDETLFAACERLWENVTKRRMYITGGVGSDVEGEAFTFDYDLPNDRAYAETCASIGLVLWAHRMLRLDADRKYADVMERALYNGVLSGISLDGTKYFYTNPLEVWPEACRNRHDLRHIVTERQPWFDCACCPPNIARLLASIPQYVYSQDEDAVYVHLFAASEATVELPGGRVTLIQETDYPWEEEVALRVRPEEPFEFTLAVRIPGWCRDPRLRINGDDVDLASLMEKGYARIRRKWHGGDRVELLLPMPIERVHAHPEVRAAAGKVAIMRGPIVYCLEEIDNGPNLAQIVLPRDTELAVAGKDPDLGGAVTLRGVAFRIEGTAWGDALYAPAECERKETPITAVPYYAWCNRKPGEMAVWIREE